MIANPRKPKKGWDWGDGETHTDPDDSWQADCSLGTGSVGFTEYDQPDAAEPKRETRRRADRVRMGFHPPQRAYEDD